VYFNKNALIAVLTIPIIFILSVLIHEYGHALGAKVVGVDNLKIYISPGYELTPEFGEPYGKPWPDGAIAFGYFVPRANLNITIKKDLFADLAAVPVLNIQSFQTKYIPITDNQYGVIALMGSALNLLISFVSALFIYKFKPKGLWFFIAASGTFLFYDILFYTIFPTFLNLPHLVFWGGKVAEPIVALSKLGVDSNISVTIILLLSVLQSLFLYQLYFGHAKLINNSRLNTV
jgi:hypothetical protein